MIHTTRMVVLLLHKIVSRANTIECYPITPVTLFTTSLLQGLRDDLNGLGLTSVSTISSSQFKVNTDEWTRTYSAQPSLEVTHPRTNRHRRALTSMNEPFS
jgi:hypothetical protein